MSYTSLSISKPCSLLQLEDALHLSAQDLKYASSTIQADLDRFQRQKVADLREMAISMARTHREWCKKVRIFALSKQIAEDRGRTWRLGRKQRKILRRFQSTLIRYPRVLQVRPMLARRLLEGIRQRRSTDDERRPVTPPDTCTRRSGRSRTVFYIGSVLLFYTTLALLYIITQRTQRMRVSCEVIKRTRARVVNTTRCIDIAPRRAVNLFTVVITRPPSFHLSPHLTSLHGLLYSLKLFCHQLHSLASLAILSYFT